MAMLQATKNRRRLAFLAACALIVVWLSGWLPSPPQEASSHSGDGLTGQLRERTRTTLRPGETDFADPHSPIHVVFTATGAYTLGLTALINSTLSSASDETRRRLRFHIISLNQQDVTSVLDVVQTHLGRSLPLSGYALADMGDPRLQDVKVWAGYRSASLSRPIVYARYLVPDVLPKEVERVIYLDQDIVVQKDIKDLWETDLEGFPIAAARLCRSSALWRKQLKMGKELLQGYSHDTCTLNNGVLVYDLMAWRQADPSYTDQLFEWTHQNAVDQLYSLGSQPPFNLVFYQNYKILDNHWNLMDIAGLHEETEYGAGLPQTKAPEKVRDAGILHWNGMFKPWSCGGEGYYSSAWTKFFPKWSSHVEEARDDRACKELVITNRAPPSHVEQFTVVIVSFARTDTVVKIATHLEHSDYVREIVVAWNNLDMPCPVELEEMPWVKCVQQTANLVHNRFLIHSHVSTEAVLHYDDDVIVPLVDIEAAFHIWRRHRNQVLGFEPRVIVCDGDTERYVPKAPGLLESPSTMPANCRYKFKLQGGFFDLVIGKIFFVHRHYMESYFTREDVVSLSNNAPCEDLAMSFLVSAWPADQSPHPTEAGRIGHSPSAKPPLLFKTNITEIHSTVYAGLSQGISSSVWRDKRHDCVQELMGIFRGQRPDLQKYFYTRDPVRERVYRLPVKGWLDQGWCSDIHGSRVCRQP